MIIIRNQVIVWVVYTSIEKVIWWNLSLYILILFWLKFDAKFHTTVSNWKNEHECKICWHTLSAR